MQYLFSFFLQMIALIWLHILILLLKFKAFLFSKIYIFLKKEYLYLFIDKSTLLIFDDLFF